MKTVLLGQGYEPESINAVGNYLEKFLSEKTFHTFTGISAFASEAGIAWLSKYIEIAKENFESLRLIVGVDQEGTSKEALLEINKLGIKSYIFYQRESPIFHPKIYLFEGKLETKLIVGSSNLTSRGLFGNVEASVLIEFSNDDEDGQRLLSEMKEYFKELLDLNDQNLFEITPEKIEDFVDEGIVPTEKDRLREYSKRTNQKKEQKESRLNIPKRPTARIPRILRGKTKTDRVTSKVIKELEIEDAFRFDPNSLIWQKKALPSSDAQQVSGSTKITGVLRLSDAGFKANGEKIDRNTYFRDVIFADLNWTSEVRKNNSPLQVAKCNFKILINGKNIGEHELKISHDPKRIAGQNNIPTTIHWGTDVIPYLKENNVTGKTLSLYNPPKDSSVFKIVIE